MRWVGRSAVLLGLLMLVFALVVISAVPVAPQADPSATGVEATPVSTPVLLPTLEPGADHILAAALRRAPFGADSTHATPTALLARRISVSELPSIGMPVGPPFGDEMRLWLLVLTGEFGSSILVPMVPQAIPPVSSILPTQEAEPLDYVIVVYSETDDRIVIQRVASGMYGLGCVFADPTLPGGLELCPPFGSATASTSAPARLSVPNTPPSPVYLPSSTPGPSTGGR